MSVDVATHADATGYAVSRGVATIRTWAYILVDAVSTWIILIGLAAFVESLLTSPSWALGIYVLGVSPPGTFVLYVLGAGLMFAAYITITVGEFGWFGDAEPEEYDLSSLSGMFRLSVRNVSGAMYTGVTILLSASVAFLLNAQGLAGIAALALVLIPALDLVLFYRWGESPISWVSTFLFFCLSPLVFFAAVAVYAFRRSRPLLSHATHGVALFYEVVGQAASPGRGSVVDELVLLGRLGR